jgi:hypothetical protein
LPVPATASASDGQSTITVQGPPDQLLCTAATGSHLLDGVCQLPDATLGLPYQGHLTTSHSAGGTLNIVSGALPAGLTLPATFGAAGDIVGGTVTQPLGESNTYTFTMQIADYDGAQATQPFSLTVAPALQISTTPMPTATVGVPYSHDLVAQGGILPYGWSVVNNINELPPGLTLDTTNPGYNNVLTGTPTQAGTFSFPMQVQDSQDNTVSGTVTFTITP